MREKNDTRDVGWAASQAADFIHRAKAEAKPLFLTVGYVDPHRDLTRVRFSNNDEFAHSVRRRKYDLGEVEVPDFLVDLPSVRQELAKYLRQLIEWIKNWYAATSPGGCRTRR